MITSSCIISKGKGVNKTSLPIFWRWSVIMIKNSREIQQIIEEEGIIIYFQPIISTYQDRVAGVEALVRGIDINGDLISPLDLFAMAREEDKVIQLDRLCQKKAIESFAKQTAQQENLILFLNVDNSVIHLDTNTNAIYDYCHRWDVSPSNVVLEINELQTSDISAMLKFVNKYREKGFMISIDDIGAGYSNLDRLILLKPDIIKIDRKLIQDIHQHYYKQQVVDMIIKLAEKIGALVVAEGVEQLEEILKVLKFGAQLLQGYYIARPMDLENNCLREVEETIGSISEAQKKYLSTHLLSKCRFNLKLRERFDEFNERLKASDGPSSGQILKEILLDFPEVECAYIIDEEGIQVTDTVFNEALSLIHRKSLFSPYKKGADAKLKAYYYVLKTTNQPRYVSEGYLSLATGHQCITISGDSLIGHKKVILCMDIISQGL